MKNWIQKNKFALVLIALVAIATSWAVRKFQKPGQLDVVSAQAMDMSAMRPPTGAAPVALAAIRQGTLASTVTYTGSVLPYNEQDISPRITGTVLQIPVYPGDRVRPGELLVQLDSAEVTAKADAARAQALQAEMSQSTVTLNHHLHHYAALDQATSQIAVAKQGVNDAQAQVQSAKDAIVDAQAGVQSAKASTDYWKVEIAREKQLADAGAASRQEYQNELSQAQAANAGLLSAQAKLREAHAGQRSALARLAQAQKQVKVAAAGQQMAMADLDVAASQIREAQAGTAAAEASAREAAVVQSYTRIVSPTSGVITERPIAPGTLVQPGTVILKVAEIDRVRIQANVAATDMDGIRTGNPVDITSADGGKTLHAKVTSVFPAANDATRTAVVEAVVDNDALKWLPGESVSMTISKSRAMSNDAMEPFLVPASAVLSQGGQSYLWVARKPGDTGGLKYKAACGFIYSAADAKKYHYICPMDHKPLVPITSPAHAQDSTPGSLIASRVDVETGATDGVSTEITGGSLSPTDRVIVHGVAGLIEGARVVETAWGPDGPKALPDAAVANAGMTVYRCEKCGMTYSAADAKTDNYIDPMDGGKLVPVKEGK